MGRHKIPRNNDAEKALLGGLMLRPKSLADILEFVDENSFYVPKHATIFKSMKSLFQNGDPIDLVSVAENMQEQKTLDEGGGISYLNGICSDVPSSSNVEYYAKIVQDKFQRRKAMEIADTLSGSSQEDDIDMIETISNAISSLASGLIIEKESSTIDSAITSLESRVQEYLDSGFEYLGTSLGMYDLDIRLEGMQRGHLGVVTGYTSSGKTAIALNVLASYVEKGKKVVMFSLEMSPAQLTSRILSILSGVPIWKIVKGKASYEEKILVEKATALLRRSNSKIYGDANWSNIQMTMLKESVDGDTELFILDYIQLVSVQGMNDYAGLKHVSKELQKQLQRFNIPMICLSQISNEMAKEDRPDIISTKGAGDIAASADWVIRLKNKEDQDTVNEFKVNDIPLPISIYIQKNRHGATGRCTLYFHTNTNKFFGSDNYEEENYVALIEEIKGDQHADVLESKLKKF